MTYTSEPSDVGPECKEKRGQSGDENDWIDPCVIEEEKDECRAETQSDSEGNNSALVVRRRDRERRQGRTPKIKREENTA